MSCHQQTNEFRAVKMHQPLFEEFHNNEISCLNCHGRAHPTRMQRTPGSEDYERLFSGKRPDRIAGRDEAVAVRNYLQQLELATLKKTP
jgi:hypothetical protein